MCVCVRVRAVCVCVCMHVCGLRVGAFCGCNPSFFEAIPGEAQNNHFGFSFGPFLGLGRPLSGLGCARFV